MNSVAAKRSPASCAGFVRKRCALITPQHNELEMMEARVNSETCIFVVDHDQTTVDLARRLAAGMHVHCRSHAAAKSFLDTYDRETPGCLVAEIDLHGMSGIELQQRMAAERIRLPLIFVTSRAEIKFAVQVMRGGAVTVLRKPLGEHDLEAAIREALARDAETRRIDAAHFSMRRRFSGLSPLDRNVLHLMMAGKSNRTIAAELDVEVATVIACTKNLLEKTQTTSLLDLARLALQADLNPEDD
jgi:FixJ family two-component response regulator